MRNPFRYQAVVWGLPLLVLITALITWVQPHALMDLMEAALLSLSAVALYTYAPMALQSLLSRKLGHTGQLLLGITVNWACLVVLMVLRITAELQGRVDYEHPTIVHVLAMYSLCISAMLHTTAPGADGMAHPRRSWVAMCIAGMLACTLFGFIAGLQIGH